MNTFFSSLISATISSAITFVATGFNPLASASMFVITFLSAYYYPRPEQASMKPASLSDFSVSQTSEGHPVPIVYGSVRIPANIIWYGNLTSQEIKDKAGNGKNSEEVTTGFNYYIDCWQSICKGKIKIEGVYKNDRELTHGNYIKVNISNPPNWAEDVTYNEGDIVLMPNPPFNPRPFYCKKSNKNVNPLDDVDSAYPFNGEYWVGAFVYNLSEASFYVMSSFSFDNSGVYSNTLKSKYIIFNDGTSDYAPTESDTGVSGWVYTRLPTVAHIFLKQFYVGKNTTFMPTLTFKVRRVLSDDVPLPYADMESGSNPVAVIYDLIVNELGLDPSYIDIDSFTNMSNYFYNNNFGINYVISSTVKLVDEINKILQYVNSFLYITSDGKIAIKRMDEDDTPVGVINEVISVTMSKPSIQSMSNIFIGNYVDNGVVHTIKTENPANIKYAGTKNIKTIDLSVFSTKDVAFKVLNEVMKQDSFPFSSLSITVPIQYSMYNCGDVITLNLEEEGIFGDFRIVEKKEEDVTKGVVSYELIQHRVVNMSDIQIEAPSSSYHTNPENIYVIDSNDVVLYESQEVSVDGKLKLYILVGNNTSSSNTFIVYTVDSNGNTTYKGTIEYSGVYELLEDMPVSKYDIDDEIILKVKPISRNYNLEYSLDRSNLFSDNRIGIIGNEIIKIQSIDTTNPDEILIKGIIRGYKNTPNERHIAGDKLFLTNSYNFITIDTDLESVNSLYLQDKLISEYSSEDKLSAFYSSGVELVDGCYAKVIYTPSNKHKIPYTPNSCVVNEDKNCLDVFVVSKFKGAGRVNPDNTTDIYPFKYENSVNYQSEVGNVNIDDTPNSSNILNLVDYGYISIKSKNEIYYSDSIYKLYIKDGISSFSTDYTVEIQNNDNVLYKDVVVPIYLDDTKIDFNSFLTPSYNDIIPYNNRFGYLDYWIENIDTTNNKILIYIKIPYIFPLSMFKFNLYIGNSNFNSSFKGSPYVIFDYYEDFSVFTGWNTHGSGVVSQDLNTFGFPTLKKSNYGDPNGGYKNVGNIFNKLDNSFSLLFRVNRTYLSGANADRMGFINEEGNGYGIIIEHTYDKLGYDIRNNFNATAYTDSMGFDIVNNWYKGEIRYNKGYIKTICSDDLFINKKEYEFEDYTHDYFNNIYVFGGYTYFVDYIAIKRFYKNDFIINIY